MKQAIFILAILLSSQLCFSQLDLSFFKASLLLPTYDALEKKEKDAGFPFDQAKKVNNQNGCNQYYIFKRNISYYTEVISIASNCSENEVKKFKVLRFITRNEDLFYKIKAECKSKENIQSISETVKDDAVVNKYSEGNFTYTFTNGRDDAGKTYMVDVEFNYSSVFLNR